MIKIKPIKTEEEYQEALEIIEGLMDAAPGSPEEEDLEVLSLLIEKYEEINFAIDLPDPVEAIKFRMDQQGLTRKDLQKYIGSQSKVSEVLNYKRKLSLPMIRSLKDGLGIPAEVLLQEPGMEVQDCMYNLHDYPFNEMFNNDYFYWFEGTLQRAKEYSEELLNKFFSVFEHNSSEYVYCRYSDTEIDTNALKAWHAKILHIASDEKLPEFLRESLNDSFLKEIISLSQFSEGPRLAKEYLNNKGIHLIIQKHLQKTYLDGACFKTENGAPVIGMTLRHDRLDNFWFTLAHELAHLFLHLENDNQAFFDNMDNMIHPIEKDCEEQADEFAKKMLIDPVHWEKESARLLNYSDPFDVINFARELSISPAIVAGRIRWEKRQFSIFDELIGRRQVKSQFSIG